jgi:hypothetical protein
MRDKGILQLPIFLGAGTAKIVTLMLTAFLLTQLLPGDPCSAEGTIMHVTAYAKSIDIVSATFFSHTSLT